MLILTRKPGGNESSITLPELNITIHIVEVRGFNQVRVGIDAPRSVTIVRTELLDNPKIVLDSTCEVDTSFKVPPLKQLGKAVQEARLGGDSGETEDSK